MPRHRTRSGKISPGSRASAGLPSPRTSCALRLNQGVRWQRSQPCDRRIPHLVGPAWTESAPQRRLRVAVFVEKRSVLALRELPMTRHKGQGAQRARPLCAWPTPTSAPAVTRGSSSTRSGVRGLPSTMHLSSFEVHEASHGRESDHFRGRCRRSTSEPSPGPWCLFLRKSPSDRSRRCLAEDD